MSANALDYEIRIFSEKRHLSIVVRASCETDTAALAKVARMGAIDYQSIEVWRELDRIYVGRSVPRSGAQNAKAKDKVAAAG